MVLTNKRYANIGMKKSCRGRRRIRKSVSPFLIPELMPLKGFAAELIHVHLRGYIRSGIVLTIENTRYDD